MWTELGTKYCFCNELTEKNWALGESCGSTGARCMAVMYSKQIFTAAKIYHFWPLKICTVKGTMLMDLQQFVLLLLQIQNHTCCLMSHADTRCVCHEVRMSTQGVTEYRHFRTEWHIFSKTADAFFCMTSKNKLYDQWNLPFTVVSSLYQQHMLCHDKRIFTFKTGNYLSM